MLYLFTLNHFKLFIKSKNIKVFNFLIYLVCKTKLITVSKGEVG